MNGATDVRYDIIMLRLGELCLKGRNQGQFTKALRRNVLATVRALDPKVRLSTGRGRLWVHLSDSTQAAAAAAVCADTPGATSVSPVATAALDIDVITETALALTRAVWGGETDKKSFAVEARRSDKSFPMASPAIERHVGGAIQDALELPVDLTSPEHVLGIELGADRAFIWVEKIRAAGGLPVGTAGRVALMLSGGIDSPVAGYMAQKRGCALDAVYFHSPPFTGEESREKVETLARKLAPRQGGLRLFVVHFTEIQKAIRTSCESAHTVLLYRRFMYRIAERIAVTRHALALCTGENLAQVASQTLENLYLVDQVTSMLTLRPLSTYDKQEIVDVARRIGTYETSILPYDDCCTLFVPRNPTIRGRLDDIVAEEAKLDLEALIAEALERTEIVDIDRAR